MKKHHIQIVTESGQFSFTSTLESICDNLDKTGWQDIAISYSYSNDVMGTTYYSATIHCTKIV